MSKFSVLVEQVEPSTCLLKAPQIKYCEIFLKLLL